MVKLRAVRGPRFEVALFDEAGPDRFCGEGPRLDPAFRNASPLLPAGHAKDAETAQVTLTILVTPDGRVGDARVAKSSGQAMLDQIALAFAKAKWHFRAALQAGRPVQDWTTVLVRFAPG